jgi:hypothetical protein
MKLLHIITNAVDVNTGTISDTAKHRIGKVVHVGELSLRNPAMFYFNDGMTITSPVTGWERNVDGKITLKTSNTIYELSEEN